MKKSTLTILTTGLLAVAIAGFVSSVSAAEDNKAKSTATAGEKKMPFYGKIAEVDKAAKTVKIGQRTFQITAESELSKDGKSATIEDATIGELAGGSFKDVSGKLEVVKMRIGPKPESANTDSKPSDKPARKKKA